MTARGRLADDTITPALFDGIYEVVVTTDGTSTATLAVTRPTTSWRLKPVRPVVTINPLVTSDTTPELSGTINDISATINVTVNGSAYAATNNGDGTWTRVDDTITPALLDGVYEVIVTATDINSNVGSVMPPTTNLRSKPVRRL